MANFSITRDELQVMKQDLEGADLPRLIAFAEQALDLADAAKEMVAVAVTTDRREWIGAIDRLGDALAKMQSQTPG